jgi:hypothetical protein
MGEWLPHVPNEQSMMDRVIASRHGQHVVVTREKVTTSDICIHALIEQVT